MIDDDEPAYWYVSWPDNAHSEPLIKWHEDQVFHIGQGYTGKPARQIACMKCGNTDFHVAQGDYFTAIRCPVCRWELCLHEG